MTILYKIAPYVSFVIGAILIYFIVYLRLPKDKKVKYIIVLGCGLRANVVVSGGQRHDEIIPEAEAVILVFLIASGLISHFI